MPTATRPLLVSLLALVLSVTAACGDKEGEDPWAFKSKAKEPSGDLVKIAYEYEVGEGVRMVMHTNGKMTMTTNGEPQEQPVDMKMAMTMRCESIGADGSRVLTTSLEDMEVAGMANMPTDMLGDAGFNGRVTIGADGTIQGVDFEGLDPQVAQSIKQAFQGGGFAGSVPMGKDGMRVGEAIDIRDVMPMDALKQAMSNMPGGVSIEPDVQGEYVLMGTRTVEGVEAAEFAVNVVMTMNMNMDTGKQGKVTMRMKMTGTQLTSLRTGLAIGESAIEQEMEMRMSGEGPNGGMDMAIDLDSTMTITAKPLSKDD